MVIQNRSGSRGLLGLHRVTENQLCSQTPFWLVGVVINNNNNNKHSIYKAPINWAVLYKTKGARWGLLWTRKNPRYSGRSEDLERGPCMQWILGLCIGSRGDLCKGSRGSMQWISRRFMQWISGIHAMDLEGITIHVMDLGNPVEHISELDIDEKSRGPRCSERGVHLIGKLAPSGYSGDRW